MKWFSMWPLFQSDDCWREFIPTGIPNWGCGEGEDYSVKQLNCDTAMSMEQLSGVTAQLWNSMVHQGGLKVRPPWVWGSGAPVLQICSSPARQLPFTLQCTVPVHFYSGLVHLYCTLLHFIQSTQLHSPSVFHLQSGKHSLPQKRKVCSPARGELTYIEKSLSLMPD